MPKRPRKKTSVKKAETALHKMMEPMREEITRGVQRPLSKDIWFILSLLVVGIVVIVGAVLFFTNPFGDGNGGAQTITLNYNSSTNESIDAKYLQTTVDKTSCMARYSISTGTVVFMYATDCAYSKVMIPYVRQLESEGYKFYWADTANGSALQPVTNCLKDVAAMASTPEFICPAKDKGRIGAFSLEELRGFAENCK